METKKPRIGWIGTGVMGKNMVARLIQAGYSVSVYNRTPIKAASLLEMGAVWQETPRKIAAVSDIVLTMVGYPADVREVVLGKEGVFAGFADALSFGSFAETNPPVFVDMTTSSPQLAEEIARLGAEKGIETLDAPVSGGDVGAKNGTLSIMIGGKAEIAERIRPLFAHLGQTIVYQGGPGRGQHAKMTNQILIAGNMAGMCEALLYAFQAGLDMESVFASVEKGAAGSWSLSNLGPRILRGDFAPGFFIAHFIKDMKIALDEAKRMNLNLPALTLVCKLYQEIEKAGGAQEGTQALIKGLAALSQIDLTRFIPTGKSVS